MDHCWVWRAGRRIERSPDDRVNQS